ncbi:adenylate kinase [Miltoncostaea marina]|uniref:adenylate kinase n=1 Tax=Miltoncostaea marina TaxID=2843215 RepID=UPI001FE4F115|nr:adenylate kinase [Miltoncostaea marina]
MLLGPPGAGKGTQAERLRAEFDLVHLATGDLLRAAVAAGTDLGREAKRFMDAGELVPDAVVVGMIRERLSAGGSASFLLDGFPRSVPQADALDGMLAELGMPLDAVVSIAVSREELVRRLAGRWICRRCGRSFHEVFSPYGGEPCPSGDGTEPCDLYQREDDRPETVSNRLAVYEEQTAPLIDYYRARGLLREVDGERTPDEVHDGIVAHIPASPAG